MFTRVFIHVVDHFNWGFAGAALDEPELVWVKQGMLVKEEGKSSGHCAGDQFGMGSNRVTGRNRFESLGRGATTPSLRMERDSPTNMSPVSSIIHSLISRGACERCSRVMPITPPGARARHEHECFMSVIDI